MNYLTCVECGCPAVGVRRSTYRGAEPLCNAHAAPLEMADHNKRRVPNWMGSVSIEASIWFERFVNTLSGKSFERTTEDFAKWLPRPSAPS